MKTPKSPKATGNNDDEHFFLPDLCASQALFFLVLVAELFSLVLVLSSSDIRAFDWQKLALVSLFVQWVALTSAAILCKLRAYLSGLKPRHAAFISYSVIPLNALFFSVMADVLLPSVNGAHEGILVGRLVNNVLIAAIIGGLVIRYFYLQAQLISRRQSELVHRIQALQSRIRPHFLFNSMNIIASLIETEPETAERVVEDLSELFRASLNEVAEQVPLDEEVALCKRYLRIEQLRLGERLKVQWRLRGVPNNLSIPLLTLQPLLENAIVHGIQPMPSGGTVEVNASYQHGVFELRVSNPYLENLAAAHAKGNHMALENTRNRLNVLYGERAKLISYAENGQYITGFSYPCNVDALKPKVNSTAQQTTTVEL